MYQVEVLQRQGSWVRKFEGEIEACMWLERMCEMHAETGNPVKSWQIIDLTQRKPLPPPQAPKKTFDEAWK